MSGLLCSLETTSTPKSSYTRNMVNLLILRVFFVNDNIKTISKKKLVNNADSYVGY